MSTELNITIIIISTESNFKIETNVYDFNNLNVKGYVT